MVRARVLFRPISQSDSERQTAALVSGCMSASLRMLCQAFKMASSVMDCIQSRRAGFVHLPYRTRLWKINSPSRPASHALTISVTSLLLAS